MTHLTITYELWICLSHKQGRFILQAVVLLTAHVPLSHLRRYKTSPLAAEKSLPYYLSPGNQLTHAELPIPWSIARRARAIKAFNEELHVAKRWM